MRAAIFVVDDDRETALSTARLLRTRGHEVTFDTDGRHALQTLLGPTEFDVTFLDLLMPDVTGGEIYNVCKERAPARLRRICFLTGASHLVPTWLKQTGLPVLDKPADAELLFYTVEQFAALDVSRGPTMGKKHKSLPDLSELVDANDDDDEENTAVTLARLVDPKHDSTPPSGTNAENPYVLIVKYVSKKHGRLAKRVERIEKFMLVGWGFFLALYVAFELFKAAKR